MDKALKLRSLSKNDQVLERNAGSALPISTAAGAFMDTFSSLFLLSVTDRAGTIIEVSDQFCKVSQYDRAELVGANHRLINSGYHPQAFFKDMWRRISSGHIWRGEICNRAKDGSLYWVDSVIAPEFGSDGKITRYVSIRTDITDRKQAENLLHTSRHFMGRSCLGWWEADMVAGTVFWSDDLCRLFGLELGTHLSDDETYHLVAPDKRDELKCAVARCIETGVGWDMELPLCMPQNSPQTEQRWIRSVGNAETRYGLVVKLFGAIQDITERVQIELLNQRVLLATESGGIGIWEYDVTKNIIHWDKQMKRLYEIDTKSQNLRYEDWLMRILPADRGDAAATLENTIKYGNSYNTEFRILRENDEIRYIRSAARVMRMENGNVQKLVGVNWDVTGLRHMAAELAEQHELLRVTLLSIGDAVITTNADGLVDWMNPVAERMTGWTHESAKGVPIQSVMNLVHQDTRMPLENPVSVCIESGKITGMAQQTLLISRDSKEFMIEDSAAPIRSAEGSLLGVVIVFRDVTEQRRYSNEMSYRATHDALTGLINRAEFETRLKRVLATAHEDGSTHAMMFIDLDQFKIINDMCGHSVGDQLLTQVARMLEHCVRARDSVARLGGDEFAILLERCPLDQARRIGEKICSNMEDFRFTHEGRRFRIGASIGLLKINSSWKSSANVLQGADSSCYIAKDSGGNRVHVWVETDSKTAQRSGETGWATRIEQALDENRFTLFAQKIRPIEGQGNGLQAEILLRLRDGDEKIVEPCAFLPAAERFHLATRIDRWVIRSAVSWLGALSNTENIDMISVNLSGQSIGDKMFHRFMGDVLAGVNGTLRAKLCLEITETSAITNMQEASRFVDVMREVGVRIALDDFGAGASSFGYLKKLKVDIIKIDGQFITDLVENSLDDAAVRCFANVASVVGVKTIAEFVNKPEVLEHLKRIGIDYGQGFMLHRPEPIEKLLEFS